MRALIPSEHAEQVALFQWAALASKRFPELKLLHAIPNGGARHIAVARKLKVEGVKAGVPDIFLPAARGGYHGLYIELKRSKGPKPTKEQEAWLRALTKAGYLALWARGWEMARMMIESYLLGAQT
ncbi:MAG: VRR-NUC domain-containing protein [Acidobacteriaceae bacterium]